MKSKTETAQFIADAHFRLNPGISRIYRLAEPDEDRDSKPIKLLEINDETPEVGIMPIGLGASPDRGVDFAVTVVEITPAEFQRLTHGELALPYGWVIGDELHAANEPSGAVA